MPTTLWQQFTRAVRWARGSTEAAIAVLQAAPAPQVPTLLFDSEVGTIAPPSSPSAGADIAGFRTVNLCYRGGPSPLAHIFTLWLMDADDSWYRLEEITLPGEATSGVLPALDTEGWARIAVSGAGDDTNILLLSVFPYNEEA